MMMGVENAIDLIKNLTDISCQEMKKNEPTYDFFIEMVKDGDLSEDKLTKLALIANKEKICKEIKNCLKIEKKKREILFCNNINLPEIQKVDSYLDDWRSYFDRLCSIVSDEAMQDIWARILVKETLQPGSISKVMLNTFSLLDNASAKSFEKLCAVTFKMNQGDDEREIPLIIYDDILCEIIHESLDSLSEEQKEKMYAYEKYIPTQKEIEYLAELNLIKTSEDHMECDIYSIEEMNLVFEVGDKKIEYKAPYDSNENRYFVCVGQVFFTQTGLALYNSIAKNNMKYEYLYDVLKIYIEYRNE